MSSDQPSVQDDGGGRPPPPPPPPSTASQSTKAQKDVPTAAKKYKNCTHSSDCKKRSFLRGLCYTHLDRKKCALADCNKLAHPAGDGKCSTHRERRERKKKCKEEACTSISVARGKCTLHNKTRCVHTDNNEQCTKFAVYRRTKCFGHMPRKQCRHGEDDTDTQCKAKANNGTFFCGTHRRGERAARGERAVAAAAASKGKSADSGPKDDARKTDGEKRKWSTKDTGAGTKRMRRGALGFSDDTVTTALAAAGRNAAPASAGRCLFSTCFLSSRGHLLCREHSGLYRCTAQTASGAACKTLTDSTSVRRTCTAHSKEKMEQDSGAIPKRQGLVACAFSSDAGVECTKNGAQVGDDSSEAYCKRHYVFTHLRMTLAALEHDDALDLSRLPGHEAYRTENEEMNWGAAVASKLPHLKPDGSIRV